VNRKAAKMAFSPQNFNESCSRLWGHLMIAEKFKEAIDFSTFLNRLAVDLGDDELISASASMIKKAAEEIVSKHTAKNPKSIEVHPSCSFCGKSPPEVRLGASSSAYICNECVATFTEIFET
jgi:hypothetical protein